MTEAKIFNRGPKMTKTFTVRAGVFGVIMSAMSACSGGSSAVDISTRNPGFFAGRVPDGAMQGAYNPAGFSTAQVQKLVTETCQQRQLTGFNTQDRTDGLVGFVAGCNAWRDDARVVEFERSGRSGVVIEITGVVSGSVTYKRIDTTV